MCPDCQAAKLTNGLWNTFNSPQCPYCTARLIQRIGKLRTPTSDAITARRRVVLADAVAWGHAEEQIRKLAKGPLCYQPEVRE
ncbi:hypothetical protein [Polaromonas sp. YR568]|uniref:hypothetical protein n=1 Tax=Polaromonas sp. YR568 TaxID=1855301 RepID=UPI00313788E8